MDDQEMQEAVRESAQAFLGGELPYTDPSSREEAIEFAREEGRRFGELLRGHLLDRIEAGDYVRAPPEEGTM